MADNLNSIHTDNSYTIQDFIHAVETCDNNLVDKCCAIDTDTATVRVVPDDFNLQEKGVDAFFKAVSIGNAKLVKYMLDLKINPDVRNTTNTTALDIAIENNHIDVMRLLAVSKDAFISACQNNDMAVVNNVLKLPHVIRNEYVNWSDDDSSKTLLIYLTQRGNAKLVSLLVEAGADIHARDHSGATALYYAADSNRNDIASLLIKAKANLNIQTKRGCSCLLNACRNNATDTVSLFLDAKADVNVKDLFDISPLNAAVAHRNPDIITLLLRAGANVDEVVNGQTTLLMSALRTQTYEVVVALIEGKADVNLRDIRGLTSLMYACTLGNHDIVRALAEAGAVVNATDSEGLTSLMYAVQVGSVEIVQTLLESDSTYECITPKPTLSERKRRPCVIQ